MNNTQTLTSFSRKLQQYSSLGAAFLLTAPVAQAEVIATNIDPADQVYNIGDIAVIDINNDGVNDFTISNTDYAVLAFRNSNAPSNSVIVANTGNYLPVPLAYGAAINSSQNFMTYSSALDFYVSSSSSYGLWKGDVTAYIGIRFIADGATHYGYIHLRVVDDSQFLLLDYAYECLPDTPLTAGDLVGGSTCFLSVELSEFKARTAQDHLDIGWQTETEIEHKGFQLQRATEGFEWEDIAWFEGQGTSMLQHEYRYADRAVQQGVQYYYRLKQVALDGRISYSDITSGLFYNDRFTMSPLMPNPVVQGENTFIEIKNPKSEPAQVTILNANGRIDAEQRLDLQTYETRVEIQTANLAAGLYFVKIATSDYAEYQKLVVQ